MDDRLRIAQLAMMLSSDFPQRSVNALYIPGLSEGMLEAPNLFSFAVQLKSRYVAPIITFNGGDGRAFGGTTPGESWPGKDFYIKELTSRGVLKEDLIPTRPGDHTGEEAAGLIATAREKNWKRIGFITIPYHFPRAFCFLVKAMQVHDWRPDIFAITSPSTNWYLPMGASQGKGTTTSEAAAYDDAAKLLLQIEKGWAASLNEVFTYLRNRTP